MDVSEAMQGAGGLGKSLGGFGDRLLVVERFPSAIQFGYRQTSDPNVSRKRDRPVMHCTR
jgi:hypothetical protein